MSEIRVPPLGESVADATVGQILKQTGAFVSENDEIIELETDKANQVLYAATKGIITWRVKAGDKVVVDQVIGSIEEKEGVKEEKVQPTPKVETPKEEVVEKLQPLKGGGNREKMSRIRKTIANRLVDALHTTAMLTTFNEVDMSQVIELREKHRDSFPEKQGIKLGFMSFFVKAVVVALKSSPILNAYIEGEEIVYRDVFDIGIAVGGVKSGLVVPVVRGADKLSFSGIEKEIKRLADKAKEGKLAIGDMEGGSFTITNGGVYGSLLSTPILNPPQSGILGMHKIEKRAVVVNDQIVIRPMMYLALSYDHRLIDGKEAITFLVNIKEALEDPSKLGEIK